MVAHKDTFLTLSNAFLKLVKRWYRFCWCWRYFSHRILRLICSVVLLPPLNPACASAIISLAAWDLKPIQSDVRQHDFARLTDGIVGSVVLAEL